MYFDLAHLLLCSPERYWELTFDPDFCRSFFVSELGYEAFEVLRHETQKDGTVSRKTKATPSGRNVPSWAKGKLTYVQSSEFRNGVFTFTTHVLALPRIARVDGTMTVTTPVPGAAPGADELSATLGVRRARVHVRLAIPFAGSVEPLIRRKIAESFDRSAEYVNLYVALEDKARRDLSDILGRRRA